MDSPIVKAFQEACKKNHIMAVPNLYLKSYGRKDGKKVYDASLLIDQDGKISGIQKMVHIAQADQFYEQDYYLPSDDGFKVLDTPFGKIGIVVCFDRHYPESIRTEALMGADCILVPTANTKTEPMEMFEQKISESGKLLLSIINNVLDMSRIESGKVELDESYVNVTDTMGRINGVFEEDIKKKGIHFTHEVDVQHPYIMCDVAKVHEILVNLISNAVKYTPDRGSVSVRTTEIPDNKEGSIKIKIEVADTGIGMSKEFIPSLFVPFSRERNTTTGRVAGTGLGMSIIKKYIDMMDGTIDVESELGKGTKFTVILRHKIADKMYFDKKAENSTAIPASDTSIRGKHILLAEDNDLNAEIAITILEDKGLSVDRVEDGIQCVAKIEQEPAGSYDLILMDIQMPNMDGYMATLKIRHLEDKEKVNIPIIAMTANAFEEDKQKAFSVGMNEHISKPIDIDKVESVLLKIFDNKKG